MGACSVRVRRAAGALALALLAAACASQAEFVWIDQIPFTPRAEPGEYRISVGDVIGVRVFSQASMSIDRTRVRADGKVSIPFLQDVEVVGMTPADLGNRLQVKLKAYIVNPVVTVTLEERAPVRVSVLGEVRTPGVYDLVPGAGVLHAIAAGGGLTDYAHRDRLFVVRHGYWADGDPAPQRIRFRWDALAAGAKAATFRLESGDVLIVE